MRFWIILLLAAGLFAATSKLYLKDGTYQLVREYQVSGDRVKYYSIERSEWEEIPLDLVDLKRTQADIEQHREALQKDAAEMAAEDKVEREQANELARVPQDTGVYLVQGEKLDLKPIPAAESKVVTDKKRSVLKVLSPIPLVAGKATVEIDGVSSKNVTSNERPEFYIRLAQEERFGIFKLKPVKEIRVVQTWSVIPVTKETVEDQQEVPIFRRELADGLYRIWPEKPLEPGEYAVVEYTSGKRNIQVWDFGYRK